MKNNFHEAQRKFYLNLFSFIEISKKVQLSNLFFEWNPPLNITILKTTIKEPILFII